MSKVRDYYDANTWKFVLSGAEGALHRELWGPGTADRRDALHYIHRRVLDQAVELCPSGEARVVDLGCGVGAGIFYLAERIPAELHGISLSPRQIARCRQGLRRRASLVGTCSFHEGDFCALSPDVRRAIARSDIAYAIESFVHAPSAEDFFAEAARALRPGGRLVLVDDFLTGRGSDGDGLLDLVRAGWQISTLVTAERAAAIAGGCGFEFLGSTCLSPYMRLGRPRDRLIRALQPLLRAGRRYSYWCQSLVGGDALQRGHEVDLLEYDELVLVRT